MLFYFPQVFLELRNNFLNPDHIAFLQQAEGKYYFLNNNEF
jgi:hypothetical protein